jgi:hypothetical protein
MDDAAFPEPNDGPPDWLRRPVRPELAGLVDDIVFYRETGLPMVGLASARRLMR